MSFFFDIESEIKKGYIVIPPDITEQRENNMEDEDFKMLCGIDSLYYFCESNEEYQSLYLDIETQIETKKEDLDSKNIDYENSDIFVNIDDTDFIYLGNSEGFYWLKDQNSFFKLGFKDNTRNVKLHDIRVQLMGIGIYSVGIKSLLEYINKDILLKYTTGLYPVTRADLNCFIEFNFELVTKDMFVTKKKSISSISEIGNKNALQTLYIGKPPFKFRLYNKLKELEKSNKNILMYQYFVNNGLSLDSCIWNIEFEMHRDHLKSFNIKTVDELLSNCNNLFKKAMEDIRLINPYSISDSELKHNRYKAKTEEIWDYVKDLYDVKEFLQVDTPLEKIKKPRSIYDDTKFRIDLVEVLNKGFTNDVFIDLSIINEVYLETIRFIKKKTPARKVKAKYLEAILKHKNGEEENLRVLEDGSVIKPVNVISLSDMSDYELHIYLRELANNKGYSDHDLNLYYVAHNEAFKRGLVSDKLPNI